MYLKSKIQNTDNLFSSVCPVNLMRRYIDSKNNFNMSIEFWHTYPYKNQSVSLDGILIWEPRFNLYTFEDTLDLYHKTKKW